MRKQCNRRHYRKTAPTIVAMHLNPEVSLQERMAVEALRGGWSTTDHFNVLNDTRNMLIVAAVEKGDTDILAVCDLAGVALERIRNSTDRGLISATSDEIKALDAMVDVSEDYWKRQSGSMFVFAEETMRRERELRAMDNQLKEAA